MSDFPGTSTRIFREAIHGADAPRLGGRVKPGHGEMRVADREHLSFQSLSQVRQQMNDIAERLAKRLFDGPIIENQYRSAFVEEMIKPSLEASRWKYSGGSWCGWDFERDDGVRLEIKQSAAAQTWSEARKIKTKGAFDIAPRTGYFSEEGARWNPMAGRPADVYAFAWNPGDDHRDPKQ